ncbi:MAG: desulfoferrodoxin [Treponema sp.]|nr:desulfoferrodoxin [Treponema sp.]
MEVKFFKCSRCGQFLTVLDPKCPGVSCCGEPATELKANTSDGAAEKHVPAVTVDGNRVSVNVGSVDHPMADDHYIQWVYVHTENGGQQKNLVPGQKPHADFVLADDKAVAVYGYCNKHGLWVAQL